MRRSRSPLLLGAATLLAGCQDQSAPTSPQLPPASLAAAVAPLLSTQDDVRRLAAGRGIVALPPRPEVREPLVRLGRLLAFDPILSGNRNISCMTCHLPAFATGDGRSLAIGEGGREFGPPRSHPGGVFIPRNAPPLFNLVAMKHLFWDGRVQMGANGQVLTPAGAQVTPAMQRVFEFGPASALALFPVTNRGEMRGITGNELAEIPDADMTGIWAALMKRLGNIPEYRALFLAAYPGTRFENLTFAHASNAVGGFMVKELFSGNSPWDRFLAGNDRALSDRQLEGARTFLTLKCSICHGGPTFSDEKFHDVAVAQIGPGVGDGASLLDDFGRMRVTGLASDKYLFRTTPLRNVELTAPYGHDGSIVSLRDFVEHYSESDKKLMAFDPSGLEPLLRGTLLPTSADILAQRDTLLNGVVLTSDLVDKLTDYMLALTDDVARNMAQLTPQRVPSGLSLRPGRR